MATTTPLAYNTGSTISGTNQIGSLAVGITQEDYSGDPGLGGVKWWMGPDEELGYVIAHPVSGNTQPTQISGVTASIGFNRTTDFNDSSFVSLSNIITNQNFTSAVEAGIWLYNNGYWTSYLAPVLSLDAGNPASYPGTGTTWTDLVEGKQFSLINGPTYDPNNGGTFSFTASSGQYAECSTSLPSLPVFTTSIWHYWDGSNTGNLPCILTEIYIGGGINYFVGNLQGSVAQGGYFNGDFQISPQFTLTPFNWYHIVITCDGDQVVRAYINGSLLSTTQTVGAHPYTSGAGIRLMRRWDNAEYWGGYLATVNIYEDALTPTQVLSQYNSTKSRFGL